MGGELCGVTGAFGYSGRFITRRLLDSGYRVRTLTNSPPRTNLFPAPVEVSPFHFDDPAALTRALEGVGTLFNTYWVRFNHPRFTFAQALANTRTLFECAKAAGVGRVVHISIANPSEDSPLEYFRGKAQVERLLAESGLSYAILRPTVLFGGADILINNIAWTLRHFPFFAIFGDGQYRLQPVHVEDLARLAVEQAGETENVVVNATGPETFTYRELASAIARIIGVRRPLVSVPPVVGYWGATVTGWLMRDVVMTRDELRGLMGNLLCAETPPTGRIALTDWARAQADTLGRHYASELARRRA
ncbi:MAG TPA: NAD(P)H-binding protein [Candidatus Sumerlaeota bacterium]|nr:NAD(P)H-binding protein [Candidatus Sumerlaeota bacterium]